MRVSAVADTPLRSNKRDASKLIAKRMTRIAKIAGHLPLDTGDDLEDANAADGDDGADGAGDAGDVGHGDQIMRHGRADLMSVAVLRTNVLPDGSQWIGTRLL